MDNIQHIREKYKIPDNATLFETTPDGTTTFDWYDATITIHPDGTATHKVIEEYPNGSQKWVTYSWEP